MKKDQDKTKEQLITELKEMRQRVVELEASEVGHKQAETILSAAEEDYLRMFELFPIGITVLDMKGVILYCNSAVYNEGGYAEGEFTGKHFSKIASVKLKDIPVFIRVFNSIVRRKIPKPFEAIYQHKDGTTGWTELHVGLTKVGGKRRIIIIQRDVTERKRAEEALRKSQEQFRQFFENEPEFCYMVSPESIITDVNRAALEALSYNKEELIGKPLQTIYAPESLPKMKQLFKRWKRTGALRNEELTIISKDGNRRTVLLSADVVRNQEGEVLCSVSIQRDITERKQTEEALLKNRDLLNETGKMAKVGGWEFDTDTFEQTWAEEIYRIHELDMDYQPTVEKGIGFYAPEAAPIISKAVQRTIDYGEPFDLELPFITAKGNHRWVHAIGKAYRKDGKTIKVGGTFQDITERKQVEEALLESEERYRSLVNLGGAVGEAIIMLQDTEQGDAIQTFVSKEWPHITGYSQKELLGMSFFDLLHPKYREASLKRHKRRMSGETISKLFEMSIITKDGTEVPIEVTSAYSTYKGERANVVFIRDITERKQAEKALRESENEIRAIADNVPGLVLYVDSDGYYRFVNKRCKEWFGIQSEEVIGRHYRKILGEAAYEQVKDYVDEVLTGHAVSFEKEIPYTLGGIRWVMARYIPDFGDDGKVEGFFALITDITESKRAEEEFENIFNLSPDMMGVLTTGGGLIRANPSWETVLGYKTEELLEMGWATLVHPDDVERTNKEVEKQLKGSHVVNFVNRYKCKDGSYKTLEWQATFAKEGIVHATARDITERKQMEEALTASEAKYRGLISNVKLGIFRSTPGPAGRFLEINPAMVGITGYSRKELLQMSVSDLYMYPEERESVLTEIAFGKGKAAEEVRFKKKDGTEIMVLDRKVVVRDDTGTIIYFDGILEDITEQKEAEEKEKQLQQELYLSSRLAAIGELAAGVTHELNNPLAGILGFSERLLRKNPNEEVSQGLEIIRNEARRAADIVQNLLAFARRHEPKKQCSDINDIVQKALELRAYELRASNIEVMADLATILPETLADFQQIQEVFLNIILNAEQVMIEAKNSGKLTIKTQRIRGYIRVSFTDDGPGISAEHLGKLFDPFFTTREEKGGTGLGLSVCHGIISEHGGKIYAESKPGKGATFFVELPLITEEVGQR